MQLRSSMKKIAVVSITAGVVALSAASIVPSTFAATKSAAAPVDAHQQAYEALMSFYKPALKGQFPSFHSFAIGSTSHETVIKTIGQAEEPAEDADGFDVYHASMGQPGYAINYKLGKIREMRYFGTNVERDTNLGGITLRMIVQHWGMPNESVLIKSGKTKQKKVTYVRGQYQLEFIFDNTNGTELNHINLTKKTIK